MVVIYGVDTEKNFGVKEVLQAVVNCFHKAHGEILEETVNDDNISKEEIEKFKNYSIENIIKELFLEMGADYDNPTKESLLELCKQLKEFSKRFRQDEIIDKHYNEIMILLNKL